MKTNSKSRFLTMLLIGALAVVAPQWAMATGTSSGTSIANKATVNYKVSTVSQTPIESSPTGNATPGVGNGTNTTFLVDDKVIFTIATNNSGYVTTYPGSSAVALKFTVTNTGNTVHDFNLSHIVGAANTFTASSIAYYEDTNSNGTYQAGTDAAITYIDELDPDTSKVVFLVATVPLAATNGQVANYALKATAYQGGGASSLGAITTNTAGANTSGVDIVLADIDSDGAGTDDAAQYNGIYVMWAGGTAGSPEPSNQGYQVSAASLTITKTSAVVYDPINNTTNPKAIPGARVEYTITIANGAGAAQATEVTVTDQIPTNTTFYVDGYNTVKGIQVTSPNLYSGAATALTNAGSDDEGDYGMTNAGKVTVSGIQLSASQTAYVKFMVTIQ